MPLTSMHQAIHGYRDGHRMLSSSVSLGADAARVMLVLSDMSGPAMQPGFDEYLTGYPLPGSEFFVFAKTWYAPEMQRPGCVWTHSLLLSRQQLLRISASSLVSYFRRPQQGGVESAAMFPVEIEDVVGSSNFDGVADPAVSAALLGAVFGQARPVIVTVEKSGLIELSFLRLWDVLWPSAKVRFSFCTGALMPRTVADALMDLQAVPRAIPSSQFRKSAGAALVLDLRAPNKPEAWVDLMLAGAARGDVTFRTWLEAAAGADAGRSIVPTLAPIFGDWYSPNASARSVLASIVRAKNLDPSSRIRLIGMAFDRADMESGATGRRELVQYLCAHRDSDLSLVAPTLEDEARRLFEQARAEGIALVFVLLDCDLTVVGERVLRAAMRLLEPGDLEAFGGAQEPYLPTIVAANPLLAASTVLWERVGSRGGEVLSQLASSDLSDEERGAVVDAILTAGCNVSADALIRFGGKIAIFRGLTSLSAGMIQLSWPWRSALSARPDSVLEWLESRSTPSLRDLDLGSRLLSPKATQSRLVRVWKIGTGGAAPLVARVAAFGLALAFWEGSVESALFAACFQRTYDAAADSCLEYEEWDWLGEFAPPLSWYREWDRCERLAAAVARLLEEQKASLETVFAVVQSRASIKKVAAIFDDDRHARPYLKWLRNAAESSSIGTGEQRHSLLDDW